MIEIAPSILSADFARLGEQIKTVEEAGASLLHVDVMDGRFVPNITVGLPVVKAIKFADYALLMSVNPGFGGQEFIPESLDKVRRLRKMIDERGLRTRIEIDGGIDIDNIADITGAGAEIIVAGSAIFGAGDPGVAVRKLREATVLWV